MLTMVQVNGLAQDNFYIMFLFTIFREQREMWCVGILDIVVGWSAKASLGFL